MVLDPQRDAGYRDLPDTSGLPDGEGRLATAGDRLAALFDAGGGWTRMRTASGGTLGVFRFPTESHDPSDALHAVREQQAPQSPDPLPALQQSGLISDPGGGGSVTPVVHSMDSTEPEFVPPPALGGDAMILDPQLASGHREQPIPPPVDDTSPHQYAASGTTQSGTTKWWWTSGVDGKSVWWFQEPGRDWEPYQQLGAPSGKKPKTQ